jgi:hypothetical protein
MAADRRRDPEVILSVARFGDVVDAKNPRRFERN